MPDGFQFRGAIGRVRFLATLSALLFVSMAVVVMLGWASRGLTTVPMLWGVLALGLVVAAGLLWRLAAAITQRLRHAGLPVWIAPLWLVLIFADRGLARATGWRSLWPDQVITPIGSLAVLLFWAALLLWPGRVAEASRAVRPARLRAPLLVGAGSLAALAAALLIDPYQPAVCRQTPRPDQADCARFGVAGRLYAAALLVRANTALDEKKPRDALALIARVTAIRPQHVFALNSRGLAHAALGDHEAAKADYDAALILAPGYIKARGNRAYSHLVLRELPQAEADFAAIRAADPATPGRADLLRYIDDVHASMPRALADLCSPDFETFFTAFSASAEAQQAATADVVRKAWLVDAQPEPRTIQGWVRRDQLQFPVMPLAETQARDRLVRRRASGRDGSKSVTLSTPNGDAFQVGYRFARTGCWKLVGVEDESL